MGPYGAGFWPDPAQDQPILPSTRWLGYHSPNLTPYVDDLPILPRRPLGGQLVAAEHVHQFHRELPRVRSWGFDGVSHFGPVLEVNKGEDTVTNFANELGEHIISEFIDLTLHGVKPEDKTRPPMVIHLHGAPNRPGEDGYPTSPIRPGQSHDYRFSNAAEAATLWYHDHSMGLTRLNICAGLAAPYWIRDEFDTGRDGNPLGLPAGEYEVPLLIADRVFYPDGRPRYDSLLVPILGHRWGGGLSGDVIVVNGKAWPKLDVNRGVYRFRLTSGSQLNDYRISLSNGMPLWVIGSDGGLLDAPVQVAALDLSAGERYDVLIDFTGCQPGEQIEMLNSMQISWAGQMPGGHRVPGIMRFDVTDRPGKVTSIPDTLRGSAGKPAVLPPLPKATVEPVNHTLNVNINPRGMLMTWLMMNIDNLMFDSPDVDVAHQGTVQQWNLINTDPTIQTHSIHIHVAQFRVLGRQDFDQLGFMFKEGFPLTVGSRWAPSAESYASGPLQPPAPYEAGWKDTVRCPRGQITRVLVRWPSAAELGFDPDAPFVGPDGTKLRGYVWHCHMLDHEDHEMMRRFRLVDPRTPQSDLTMPMDDDMDMSSGHGHG